MVGEGIVIISLVKAQLQQSDNRALDGLSASQRLSHPGASVSVSVSASVSRSSSIPRLSTAAIACCGVRAAGASEAAVTLAWGHVCGRFQAAVVTQTTPPGSIH